MSKSRHASEDEVETKIKEIRDYYELGCSVLPLPPGHAMPQKALELGCSADWLRVARRFASPAKGYSQDEVDDLCVLIRKHRSGLGISFIGILLAIPRPQRDAFQRRCIKKNWSRRDLKAEKTKRFRPKSKGGRRPQITPGNAVVQLKDDASAFCRLFVQMWQAQDQQPSVLDSLPDHLREAVEAVVIPMKRLRSSSVAHLRKMQQDG